MPISAPERAELLVASGITAGYGKLRVLEGVDMTVGTGEVVALLGPNGAGKSTLLSALSGLLAKTAGTVRFAGTDLSSTTPQQAVRAGLVHVLEGHRVFAPLSVHENLLLAGFNAPPGERAARLEEAYAAFPEMAERRGLAAGSLSGGQQQMLVVAQGIVRRPRLLMLDEPSMGLAPAIADTIFERVSQIHREHGLTILLVEQRVAEALELSDHGYVLETGRVVLDGSYETLMADDRVRRSYLGLTEA